MGKSEAEGAEPQGSPERHDERGASGGPDSGRRAARVAEEASGAEVAEDRTGAATEEGLEEETAAAEELMAELDELRDRHLRLAAEFDNYRRRTRQELLKTRELGAAELARRLLEPLDDLRRVTETPGRSATLEALHEGVALVERKLLKELREAGLERIEPRGERFDPNQHEALSSVPTDDPEQDQVVVDVFLPGYRFGDRLLRPARVAVGTYRPEGPEADAAGEGEPEGAPPHDREGGDDGA